jgi:hypothetical protein
VTMGDKEPTNESPAERTRRQRIVEALGAKASGGAADLSPLGPTGDALAAKPIRRESDAPAQPEN